MTTALATNSRADAPEIIERVLTAGDLGKLSPEERVEYYGAVCRSLSLNPLTRPFEYITLNGKLTLYARKDATDQLRKQQKVSITSLERERLDDLYVVTATARTGDGRSDSSIGAVMVKGLAGEALANALMKAETKAKRRVTLSICGLGITDESEVEMMQVYEQEGPPSVPIREHDVEDQPKAKRARSRDELADRYAQLVTEATEKGIKLEPEEWGLTESDGPAEIAAKGKALHDLIERGDGSETRPF